MGSTERPGRQRIVNALVELLQEHGIDEIPVKLLVSRANVNKSTFYYNFTGIESVAETIVREFVSAYLEYFYVLHDGLAHDLGEQSKSLRATRNVFEFFSEHRIQFDAIRRAGRMELFRELFTKAMTDETLAYSLEFVLPDGSRTTLPDELSDYFCRSIAGLTIAMLETWATNGYDKSPEELLEMLLLFFDLLGSQGSMSYEG